MTWLKTAVIAALLCLTSLSSAAAAPLARIPSTPAAARENVKYGEKAWDGPKDLSFKYKIEISGGALHAQVDVTDDKVFLKKEDTVVSDHVEIWLADAALADRIAGKLENIEVFTTETLQQFKQEANNPEAAQCDEFQKTMREIEDTAATLTKEKHFTQLIFNQGRLLPVPEKRIPAKSAPARAVKFDIKPAPGGYTFSAEIPLEGLIDALGSSLEELAFMIDVSDIDTPSAAKQESLMSSSAGRIFGDPMSFSRVKLEPAMPLKLTPRLRMLSAIEQDSYLRAEPSAPGGYVFLRDPGFFVMECNYWLIDEVPAKFEPFSLEPLKPLAGWQSNDAEIFAYGANLALIVGEKATIIPLADKLNGTGGFSYKLLHRNDIYTPYPEGKRPKPYFAGMNILIQADGASRYPMGNGMCGGGMETDIVFLSIGADMSPEKIVSEPVESCYKNIVMNNLTLRLNDTSNAKGDVQIDYEQFLYDTEKDAGETTRKSLIYTSEGPKAGIAIETTGVEKN